MVQPTTRIAELGAFLRDKRAHLAPAAIGFPADGDRRTSGLRRDEVALVADVSCGYYTRIEQGRVAEPSAGVLSAIATALCLTTDERAYVFALLGHADPLAEPEVAPADAQAMLNLVAEPAAAYIIDRVSDVLAWNPVAGALFPHLATGSIRRPNNTRFVFTDPAARQLFVHWDVIASDSAAHLRAAAGHRPEDPALRDLIAEMLAARPDFARAWRQREVRRKNTGQKELAHPVVGRLSLDYQVLEVPGSADQRIVAYTADRGTSSRSALEALLPR